MYGKAALAILLALAVDATGLAAQPIATDGKSGYAGQQSRAIKALSDDDVIALRNGDGMGLAKAAELNGYPGPRHVLDLASGLRLSESQVKEVTAIRNRMSGAARALGVALIERERVLDRLFAEGKITLERLAAETEIIGDIQAMLRAAHLAAHIETRSVLSAEQVAQYKRLRGYGEPAAAQPGHSEAHPGGHRH
jgi:Spy/CpxP family protein refolding chaperone